MKKSKEETKKTKIFKGSKGITLIALVITIIVLLILAAVSIATLTGDNGILTQATRAREETRGGEVDESIKLWKTEKQTNKLTGITTTNKSKEELQEELKDNKLLTEEEYQSLLNGEEITIGSRTISIEEAKTLVQAFRDEEIKVGDYITNYNSTLKNSSASVDVSTEKTGHTGVQQYKVDTNTTWRVLGLDETGTKLMITTGSPIKKVMKPEGEDWETDPYLYLTGAEGWYWAGEAKDGNILDEICAIYDSNFADETRSMRIEDINVALGLTLDKTVEGGKLYKTDDPEKTPLEGYSGHFGQSYTYKSGDYAPENYLKATYKENEIFQNFTDKKIGDSVNGTAFHYEYTDASIVDQSSKLYDVLFKGTTEDEEGVKSYWLASPGFIEEVNVGGKAWGPGCVSRGAYGGPTRAFRQYVWCGNSDEVWFGCATFGLSSV